MYMHLLYIHIANFTYIQVLKNEDKEIGPKKTFTRQTPRNIHRKVKVLPILINGGQHTRLAVVHLVQPPSINHLTCQNRRAVSGNIGRDSSRGEFCPYYDH